MGRLMAASAAGDKSNLAFLLYGTRDDIGALHPFHISGICFAETFDHLLFNKFDGIDDFFHG